MESCFQDSLLLKEETEQALSHTVSESTNSSNNHCACTSDIQNSGASILPETLRYMSFSGGSAVKNLTASTGDPGLIPGLGRFPREENGNPL